MMRGVAGGKGQRVLVENGQTRQLLQLVEMIIDHPGAVLVLPLGQVEQIVRVGPRRTVRLGNNRGEFGEALLARVLVVVGRCHVENGGNDLTVERRDMIGLEDITAECTLAHVQVLQSGVDFIMTNEAKGDAMSE